MPATGIKLSGGLTELGARPTSYANAAEAYFRVTSELPCEFVLLQRPGRPVAHRLGRWRGVRRNLSSQALGPPSTCSVRRRRVNDCCPCRSSGGSVCRPRRAQKPALAALGQPLPAPIADACRERTPGQLIPPYELALADFARHLALSARQRTAGRLPGVRPEYAGNRQWGRLRPGRCAVQSVAGVWDGGVRACRCANSRYPGGQEGPRYGRIPKCRALRSDRLR